jgi:hypothetical protein
MSSSLPLLLPLSPSPASSSLPAAVPSTVQPAPLLQIQPNLMTTGWEMMQAPLLSHMTGGGVGSMPGGFSSSNANLLPPSSVSSAAGRGLTPATPAQVMAMRQVLAQSNRQSAAASVHTNNVQCNAREKGILNLGIVITNVKGGRGADLQCSLLSYVPVPLPPSPPSSSPLLPPVPPFLLRSIYLLFL